MVTNLLVLSLTRVGEYEHCAWTIIVSQRLDAAYLDFDVCDAPSSDEETNIAPQDALHPSAFSTLPSKIRVVSDNYSHLHEQPTVFYALAIYTHLAGVVDPLSVFFAWVYVLLRIVHSFTQIFLRNVSIRFIIFVLSTIILMIMTFRNIIALLA